MGDSVSAPERLHCCDWGLGSFCWGPWSWRRSSSGRLAGQLRGFRGRCSDPTGAHIQWFCHSVLLPGSVRRSHHAAEQGHRETEKRKWAVHQQRRCGLRNKELNGCWGESGVKMVLFLRKIIREEFIELEILEWLSCFTSLKVIGQNLYYTENLCLFPTDCFFKQCEWTFALADYQQAEEMDPDNTAIWLRLAIIHYTLGLHSYKDKYV